MAHLISKACNKCGACLPECPTGSILEGPEQFIIDADTCLDHAACVAVCPVNAITLIAEKDVKQAVRVSEEEEEE